MPSHSERVRRNYRCPDCEGEGRIDDYEGSYSCSTCDAAGVVLHPLPIRRLPPLTPAERLCADECLRVVKNNLTMLHTVNRSYPHSPRRGKTI